MSRKLAAGLAWLIVASTAVAGPTAGLRVVFTVGVTSAHDTYNTVTLFGTPKALSFEAQGTALHCASLSVVNDDGSITTVLKDGSLAANTPKTISAMTGRTFAKVALQCHAAGAGKFVVSSGN
jgi:hypothetical protein